MNSETVTKQSGSRGKRRALIFAGYVAALLVGAGGTFAVVSQPALVGDRAVARKPVAALPAAPSHALRVTVNKGAAPVRLVPVSSHLPQRANLADLAERLLPAVVSISTTQVRPGMSLRRRPNVPPGSPFEDFFKDYFDRNRPGMRRATAVGSGFIIHPSGYIVTNNHVIANATEVKVILQDKTKLDAKVVGRDPKADLALLKVKTSRRLPSVAWGDSARMRVGESVVAIGNPFGLGGTVTAGIISARHRHIGGLGGRAGSSFVDFLQTDAAINKGNSGGPLFNMKGEVIGINTAIYSRRGTNVGIAFAIPSNLAKPIVGQLRKFGRTKRGWLGVQIQKVNDEIAQSLGLKKATGALVANVTAGSPAERGGIRQGDVILRFDNQVVPEMQRLPRMVAATEVGRVIDVVVWRKGREVTLKIKLGELEKAERDGRLKTAAGAQQGPGRNPAVGKTLGLTLSRVTGELRQRFNLRDGSGVVVVDVDPRSPAAEKGIRQGDVILEAGQVKVSGPAAVGKIVAKARRSGDRSILLLVRRGSDTRFLALRIQNR